VKKKKKEKKGKKEPDYTMGLPLLVFDDKQKGQF
jgi:hypothetical protein